MNEPVNAMFRRRARNRFRTLAVNCLKTLSSTLEQDAYQIDDGRHLAHHLGDVIVLEQIGFYDLDLADAAHRAQEMRSIGVAHTDANAPAVSRQRPHDVASEKAGTAEYGDQLRGRNGGHLQTPESGRFPKRIRRAGKDVWLPLVDTSEPAS